MIKLCSPDHNSTAVLVGDKLYAGTAADYQVLPSHHAHDAGGGDGVCEKDHGVGGGVQTQYFPKAQ